MSSNKKPAWKVYGYLSKKDGALALAAPTLTRGEAIRKKDWWELCLGIQLKVVALWITQH